MFQIGARADPSTNNPESFAAILFFELADGSRIEVAKVDNAEHDEGEIHLDRFYRETGADIKDFQVPISNLWEAEDHLNEHARTYGALFCRLVMTVWDALTVIFRQINPEMDAVW
ncbi:hypothetical protein C465_13705, partial [Halorubrum distributum JCM 9100]